MSRTHTRSNPLTRLRALLALLALLTAALTLGIGCDGKRGGSPTTGRPTPTQTPPRVKPNSATNSATNGATAGKTAGQTTGKTPPTPEQKHGALAPGTSEQRRLLTIAKRHYLAGDETKAITHFEQLAATTPASAEMVSGTIALGDLYHKRGRSEEAMMLYKLLDRRAPKVPEVQLMIARTLADRGQHREALQHFERVLELRPIYIFVWPSIGELNLKLGDKEAAAKAYLRYEQQITGLARLLEQGDKTALSARAQIIDAFSLIEDERASKALVAALKDPHPGIRKRAAGVLGELREETARAALQDMMMQDKDPEARAAAKQALRALAGLGIMKRPSELKP